MDKTFTVEESSYKPYVNDVSVYEVYVTQSKEGNELSGEGEQKRYNGNYAKKRFKMKFTHGTIKKNEVTVRYNLYGSRPTEGIIMLTLDPKNNKRLTGRFSGSAANTKGSVEVLIL